MISNFSVAKIAQGLKPWNLTDAYAALKRSASTADVALSAALHEGLQFAAVLRTA